MVLFYCTFGSLKGHNSLTLEVDMDEYKLQGEKRLFQAYVFRPIRPLSWASHSLTARLLAKS